MDQLTLCLLQSDLFWENPEKNLNAFGKLMDEVTDPVDLILLPETFNTGFSMNPARCAEPMSGATISFLKEKAEKKNCMIIGSFLVSEKDHYFNRLVCVRPDGSYEQYDKRHLFRLSDEYNLMTRGNERIIVQWKGWKIRPLVCYDLRFPVWSRNTWKEEAYSYDLLVYVANWPGSRSRIWNTLLPARAIENLAYAAGVNRTGKDGHGTGHTGESMVAGPDGRILGKAGKIDRSALIVRISGTDLDLYRKKFPFGPDWDAFSLK